MCLFCRSSRRDKENGTVKVDLADIYITRNGANVDTNPAQLNAWVGEKIAVSVGSKGQIPGMAKYLWCMSGVAVNGYTGYSENDLADSDTAGVAKVFSLTSGELENGAIDFYWVDGGSHELQVAVTVLGQSKTDSASFTISRPGVTVTAVDSGVIRVIEFPNGSDRVELSNENFNFTQGIKFSRTNAGVLAENSGAFRWTQIVTDDWAYWVDENGLDHSYQKPIGIDNHVSYVNSTSESAWDSPYSEFDDVNWTTYSRSFSASMYLMYRASSAGSIWVPLNVTDWHFDFVINKAPSGHWFMGNN